MKMISEMTILLDIHNGVSSFSMAFKTDHDSYEIHNQMHSYREQCSGEGFFNRPENVLKLF